MIGPYKDYLFFYYLQVNYTIYKKSQCQSAGGRAPAAARLHSLKVKFNQSFLHITRKHLQKVMRARVGGSGRPARDEMEHITHHTVKCWSARARAARPAPATRHPHPAPGGARQGLLTKNEISIVSLN